MTEQYSKHFDLTEKEQKLLDICKLFYQEKRQITREKIYLYTRRKYEISKMDVYNTIDSLIRKKYILPDRFLMKNAVLENNTRSKIFQQICNNYTMTSADIKEALQIGNNVLSWNIKILIDFGFINRCKVGKRYIFYKSGENQNDVKAHFILSKKEGIHNIFRTLIDRKISLPKTIEISTLDRSSLAYYLKLFDKMGLIDKSVENEMKYISISKNYRESIGKALNLIEKSKEKPISINQEIESLYIMYPDGRDVFSYVFKSSAKKDAALVAGMFSAIVSFIKETTNSTKPLRTIDHGDSTLLIEYGTYIFGVIFANMDSEEIRSKLRRFVEEFERKHQNILKDWNGTLEPFRKENLLVEYIFDK